uniref:KOW domain-containing protein n=2 Tax=Ditylum brightwellii TaxID=49249 RepID=A0A7S4RLA6_9STRA|mmetsp:Transcript_24917/g.33177  ORF Transcript_24917/g.33177 Transcript_24917/m.33177 type:complete len:318 (-) Transcript_24917:384-1337(-)
MRDPILLSTFSIVLFLCTISNSSAFQTVLPAITTATTNSGERAFSSDLSLWMTSASSEDELKSRRTFLGVATASVLGSGFMEPANAFQFPEIAGKDKKSKPRLGGLPSKIRGVVGIMDELQRDLMQERWDLVEKYPGQFRSYVPVFTTYTDSAFPSDEPTDQGLRVALRYEVGRFFASLERLRQATTRRSLNEAYTAYADMSLHFDRYLRVGGLYTYYDSLISTEPLFTNIPDNALIFSDPKKDPPEVRDLVVVTKGPDKGKIGIVIGIYPDGKGNCVVKLDRYKGLREIRVLPLLWVGKRLGEQDPDDVFLIPRKS